MGPTADFDAPIVRTQPIAASDVRQYLHNTATNSVPDEWGVVDRHKLPQQQIVPAKGGKYSGRTGPI